MNTEKSRKVNTTKRIPVSGNRDILSVEGKDPNFVYRWVNDVDGRVDRFKLGGYEVVEHDVEVGQRTVETSNGTSSVVSKNVGVGRTAYLMRIPKEYYDEDQKVKNKLIDDSEADMKRALNSNQNGTYGKVEFE